MSRTDKFYLSGILAALALAAVMVGVEVATETESIGIFEFLFDTLEKTLLLIGAGGVLLLLQHLRRQHREQLQLLQELHLARNEGQDWRRRVQTHMDGLGKEIERQFRQWGLTDAEQEVGQLLLKGMSHKDIAALRGTAETTVRQQARSVYQKSGLQGKAGFSAYFLEDLLPGAQLRNTGLPAAESDPKGGDERKTPAAENDWKAPEGASRVTSINLDQPA